MLGRKTMGGSRVVLAACGMLLLTGCPTDDSSTPNLGSDALSVEWSPTASASAFSNLSSSNTSLQLNLSGAPAPNEHSVEVNSNSDSGTTSTVDLMTQSAKPSIVGDPLAPAGAFVISHDGKDADETYDTFNDFVSALSKEVSPSTAVADIGATGQYNSSSNTFTASSIAILLNN